MKMEMKKSGEEKTQNKSSEPRPVPLGTSDSFSPGGKSLDFNELYKMLQLYQNEFLFRVEYTNKLRFRSLCCVLILSILPYIKSVMGVEFEGDLLSSQILKLLCPLAALAVSWFFYRQMNEEGVRQICANKSRLRQLEMLGKINPNYDYTEYRALFHPETGRNDAESSDSKKSEGKYGKSLGLKYNKRQFILELVWCTVLFLLNLTETWPQIPVLLRSICR